MAFFGKKKQSDRDLLLTIAQNQLALAKKLEAVEKKLEKFDKKQSENFGHVLRGLFIMYGKAVMARLNFIELSEGKPISVSENEMREIRNSLRDDPDPDTLVLPLKRDVLQKPTQEFKNKRKSKLN